MPAFHPAASPRFSRSSSRTRGNRSRTRSSVPSVEPWSTTTVSWASTLARHGSSHGSASYVTTTTATSAMPDARPGKPADALPGEDRRPGQRERERHDEEEEARREGAIRVDVQVAEEADEEGLAHGEAVDRERNEDDEEEERAHDVEGPRPERHAHRLRREPDREYPERLHDDRQQEHADEERPVCPVRMDPLVDHPQRP